MMILTDNHKWCLYFKCVKALALAFASVIAVDKFAVGESYVDESPLHPDATICIETYWQLLRHHLHS